MIKIQGHRGYSDLYPENTMIAFTKGYETGAFAIEMDVRISADGEYVIIHDETVNRTTNGTGNVKFINYYGYMDTLDAGSWFDAKFAGTKLPTLDEVLTEFKTKNVKLVLHFYFTGSSTESDIKGAIDKVVSHGMVDNVHIFGTVDIINIAKVYNSALYTLNGGMATITTYKSILDNAIANGHNAVSISSDSNDANAITMISDIKSAGKEVHVSYLSSNYESRVQRFINLGADYILGNNPGAMQAYVDSLNPTEPEPPVEPPEEPEPEISAGYMLDADYLISKSYGRLKVDLFIVKKQSLLKVDVRQTFGTALSEVDIDNPITNLITNGDFSKGVTGWTIAGGNLTTSNNTGIIAMSGTGNLKQFLGDPITGDKYYARLKVTPRFVLDRIDLVLRGSTSINTGLQTFQTITSPAPNVSHVLSGIATVQSTHTGQVETPFRFYIAGSEIGNIEVQYFMVINLTKTFGAGKEPTKAEMDAIMSKYPNSWFDGSVEIL